MLSIITKAINTGTVPLADISQGSKKPNKITIVIKPSKLKKNFVLVIVDLLGGPRNILLKNSKNII